MSDADINSKRPIVLTFARYYLPGYLAGGPIRTIANMVDRLSDDLEFRIVTLDRDLGQSAPYPDIERGVWMKRGEARVSYLTPDEVRLKNIIEITKTTPHHVIYLNSFFDPGFTQLFLLARRLGRAGDRPIVLAPRGEFSEGALGLKALKKRCFINLARGISLYSSLIWQASSRHELADITRSLGSRVAKKIVIAPNLGPRRESESEKTVGNRHRSRGPLQVSFLSRISRKKNLDFALRVLGEVSTPVQFSVYGPIEDFAYWEECQAIIRCLPRHIDVIHRGPIKQEIAVKTLQAHDLFLFPTRGENFGHVIHEALRAGLPILISDQTPWRGLADKGVGWDLPLANPVVFAQKIEEVASWSDSDRENARRKVIQFAEVVNDDGRSIDANKRLFLNAIQEVQFEES